MAFMSTVMSSYAKLFSITFKNKRIMLTFFFFTLNALKLKAKRSSGIPLNEIRACLLKCCLVLVISNQIFS